MKQEAETEMRKYNQIRKSNVYYDWVDNFNDFNLIFQQQPVTYSLTNWYFSTLYNCNEMITDLVLLLVSIILQNLCVCMCFFFFSFFLLISRFHGTKPQQRFRWKRTCNCVHHTLIMCKIEHDMMRVQYIIVSSAPLFFFLHSNYPFITCFFASTWIYQLCWF